MIGAPFIISDQKYINFSTIKLCFIVGSCYNASNSVLLLTAVQILETQKCANLQSFFSLELENIFLFCCKIKIVDSIVKH